MDEKQYEFEQESKTNTCLKCGNDCANCSMASSYKEEETISPTPCETCNQEEDCEGCLFEGYFDKPSKMTYKEEKRDLFGVSTDYALAHCISADFALGAGIAVLFKNIGVKAELMSKYAKEKPYQNFTDGYCLKTTEQNNFPIVYNLITKQRSFHKPTYGDLQKALNDMKEQMRKDNIKKIAMPYIGCGLDGLIWEKVSRMIKETFSDMNVEILICYI